MVKTPRGRVKRKKKTSKARVRVCIACGGTGVSSKGNKCIPCDGKGRMRKVVIN